MNTVIKPISAEESYTVRHPVLREGQPLESCHFDGDTLSSTHHFGLFTNNSLVGVVSLYKNKNELFQQNKQFQLRGMAVLAPYQRQRLGENLIDAAEDYVKKNGGEIIWFNARESAVNFYKRLGYKVIGIPFNINDIGTHYIMSKVF